MSELLRIVPINKDGSTNESVSCVCYHPIAEKRLKEGGEAEPMYCAVEYEFDATLQELCVALGWQGGTLSQVIDEIKKLTAITKAQA